MNSQINPLLIQLLSDKEDSNIEDFPDISLLPGKYVKTILKNKKLLDPLIEENYQTLTCKSCGKKGKYDVGMIVVNTDKNRKDESVVDHIQMTGYFRCKHCNAAGNWKLPANLPMLAMIGIFLPKGNCRAGKNLLFDGSWHRYLTDAEEYLLNLLKDHPQDSFVWNRLGNLYNLGNRPELAVSVFEHSIMIDPGQAESHFTLGDMLAQIDDVPNAGYHLHQMLLSAEAYEKMPAEKLREMLANGLQLLFMMFDQTSGEVPFLPTLAEIEASGRSRNVNYSHLAEMELEIFPDHIDSFYPLAEMYMGIRAKEIPITKITLKMTNASNTTSKQRKQKLTKKKKRK